MPGPASSQLGFSLGLLRAGWLGALAAFVAFTLPSALALVGLATVLPRLSGSVGVAEIHGLRLVACAVVADAVQGMARKLCPDAARRTIAILAAATLLLAGAAWVQLVVVGLAAMAGAVLLSTSTPRDAVALAVPYGSRSGGLLLLATASDRWPTVAEAFYRAGALVFGGATSCCPCWKSPWWLQAG
ncbi:chromate transporter [Cyanobium sp. NS01]|nr:chromate transporter [Cyanobium sp. NS01]QNI69414.1 chromate transporter [Cyanobium sp. NS01]